MELLRALSTSRVLLTLLPFFSQMLVEKTLFYCQRSTRSVCLQAGSLSVSVSSRALALNSPVFLQVIHNSFSSHAKATKCMVIDSAKQTGLQKPTTFGLMSQLVVSQWLVHINFSMVNTTTDPGKGILHWLRHQVHKSEGVGSSKACHRYNMNGQWHAARSRKHSPLQQSNHFTVGLHR